MRVLITGVDDQGRSCVVEERTPSVDAVDPSGITIEVAAKTESYPPPARPPGRGYLQPVTVTPGIARWSFIEFPSGTKTGFHHTDSVDFDVILEGSVDVLLDDGPHRLDRGDGVLVTGVDHGWETHGDGCRMGVVVIGTPPLE
jgi:hypothetical protein